MHGSLEHPRQPSTSPLQQSMADVVLSFDVAHKNILEMYFDRYKYFVGGTEDILVVVAKRAKRQASSAKIVWLPALAQASRALASHLLPSPLERTCGQRGHPVGSDPTTSLEHVDLLLADCDFASFSVFVSLMALDSRIETFDCNHGP